LFLFECATQEVRTLRPAAQRLGLTVQAVSHLYRQLTERGLVEVRDGLYRPTVAGYSRLQGTLSLLQEEIQRRLAHLQVVRTTRAVAAGSITKGDVVSLELDGGILVARPGRADASKGIARGAAKAGELVEVGDLRGIVPIVPGSVHICVVRTGASGSAGWTNRAGSRIRGVPHGLLGAQGLEAYHLVRSTGAGAVVRFGVAAAALDAARLGVPSLVFVTEEELPRFLALFSAPGAPSVDVSDLGPLPLERTTRSSRRARAAQARRYHV
jgi:putative transcriptional regulator